MRIYNVKKTRKARTCYKCRTSIPVGSPMHYIEPRYGGTKYYHSSCSIRQSDMTSSDKLQRLYQARESIEDSLSISTEPDEVISSLEGLKTVLEEASSTAEEVGEEYQDSADAILQTFSSSPTADDCEEKSGYCQEWQESLDSAVSDVDDAISEIQSILDEEFEDPGSDEEGEENTEALQEKWEEDRSESIQEKVDEAVEAASTAAGELSL